MISYISRWIINYVQYVYVKKKIVWIWYTTVEHLNSTSTLKPQCTWGKFMMRRSKGMFLSAEIWLRIVRHASLAVKVSQPNLNHAIKINHNLFLHWYVWVTILIFFLSPPLSLFLSVTLSTSIKLSNWVSSHLMTVNLVLILIPPILMFSESEL